MTAPNGERIWPIAGEEQDVPLRGVAGPDDGTKGCLPAPSPQMVRAARA
jgi:hypothetical protein